MKSRATKQDRHCWHLQAMAWIHLAEYLEQAGPNPIVTLPLLNVELFRDQVEIIDMIGTVDIDKIAQVLVT